MIGRRLYPGATEVGPVAQRILAAAPCAVLVVAPGSQLWSRRVLVAFDGSDAARSATELAAQLAKPRQLPITLFSITDSSGQLPPEIEDAAQLSIAKLRLDGLTGDLAVGNGNIAEGILEGGTRYWRRPHRSLPPHTWRLESQAAWQRRRRGDSRRRGAGAGGRGNNANRPGRCRLKASPEITQSGFVDPMQRYQRNDTHTLTALF